MFSLIVILSFSKSLATKCLFLNDEPCMVRPTLIDMNPFELKYSQFMITLKFLIVEGEGVNSIFRKFCIPISIY